MRLTLRSRPLPSVAGRCAIKLRAAPLTYNYKGFPIFCKRTEVLSFHS